MEHSLNICNTESENRRDPKSHWVGLFVNLILSMIKFIVGIIGHSQAIVADSIHSLSDIGYRRCCADWG